MLSLLRPSHRTAMAQWFLALRFSLKHWKWKSELVAQLHNISLYVIVLYCLHLRHVTYFVLSWIRVSIHKSVHTLTSWNLTSNSSTSTPLKLKYQFVSITAFWSLIWRGRTWASLKGWLQIIPTSWWSSGEMSVKWVIFSFEVKSDPTIS